MKRDVADCRSQRTVGGESEVLPTISNPVAIDQALGVWPHLLLALVTELVDLCLQSATGAEGWLSGRNDNCAELTVPLFKS